MKLALALLIAFGLCAVGLRVYAQQGPQATKAVISRTQEKPDEKPLDKTPTNAETNEGKQKESYVSAIRDLYEHLEKVYPNFALKKIDWKEVGEQLLPRAKDVETEEQFGLLVEELVARLEDSHAYILKGKSLPPSPRLPEWDPGIACLIDDVGRPVLYVVHPSTQAWKVGLRPGMAVVAVNGVPANEAILRWERRQRTFVGYSSDRYLRYDAARLFHRQEEQGAKLVLEVETPDGSKKTVDLKAEHRGWYISRLPVPRQGINDGGRDVQWIRLKDDVGYILVRRIRVGLEASLDRALTELGKIRGLVLDVRGNSGGGFEVGTAFQNFDRSEREGVTKHDPHYDGAIALLIDERCISAGEGWTSWFIANKRARLFGTTTAGASSRKEVYTLSNGLYKVQIPVKAYTGFLDRPIERRGLEPDVEVRCRAQDIAQGKDTVLQTALDWLLQADRP